jgi:hypothetical protein
MNFPWKLSKFAHLNLDSLNERRKSEPKNPKTGLKKVKFQDAQSGKKGNRWSLRPDAGADDKGKEDKDTTPTKDNRRKAGTRKK